MNTAMDETPKTEELLGTFAADNGLLAEVDEQFLGQPGRKTTQTENEG